MLFGRLYIIVVRLANYTRHPHVNNKNFDFILRTTRPVRHNLANQNESFVPMKIKLSAANVYEPFNPQVRKDRLTTLQSSP